MELPSHVIEEAEKAIPPSLGDREDLRDVPLLTIDPADAKDHDDAVFAVADDDPSNKGGYIVIVAIADVSWFVKPGSALDKEARTRGNSVYLPDRVIPMLPERLSNNLCSLREHEDRPCLAVELKIAEDGRKLSHRFMRAMMRSAARLSYEEAQERMQGDAKGVVDDTLRTLNAAFAARWTERSKRAPLDLDLPERRIVFAEDGTVERITLRERKDAHRLIEEFMILANVAAAETLETKTTRQIYRVHDAPDEEKLATTREYLESLGYSLTKGGSVRPVNFNQLLKLAGEQNQKEMVSEIVLRTQQQAVYATENVGHFGLNLARYSHFTSPIRRYADLTIHRALVKACKLGQGGQTKEEEEELDDTAELISDLERRAMAAERESKDRYLASYLEERVGDEFEGRVRGVTRFGLFVSLHETGADGFVPMRSLGFERFRYEEERHAVVGENTGGSYFLGQDVSVRLAEAAPLTGGLRFDMLTPPVSGKKTKRTTKSDRGAVKSKFTRKKTPGKNAKKPARKVAKATLKKKKKRKSNAKSRAD